MRRIAVCVPSISPNSLMKLSASTFSTARILRLAGFKIDGAVDVEPLTARRLLHRDGDVLAGPAAGRPYLMGRMNRIDEDDGLVGAHRVEQVLVLIDEGLLSGAVKAARHGLRLAVVEAQTMQQGDQAGTAIALAEGPFQEGRDLSDAAGTVGVDPIAQRAFLLAAEAAAAAFVAEVLQFSNATSLEGAMPAADRIVVQQQSRRDTLAAPALVEKDDGVRPAGHAMLRKSIPRKPGQGSSVLSRQKTTTNHTPAESCSPAASTSFSAPQ